MAKTIYITGGARSGKSSFAESLLDHRDDVLYAAAAVPFDDEMRHRIARHQSQRNPHWNTAELYRGFDQKLPTLTNSCGAVLFECLTIMTTNLMLEHQIDWDTVTPETASEIESTITAELDGLLNWANQFDGTLIIVSNETGMGIVPDNALSRWFRDFAGRVNQKAAAYADEVYFLVSGIPMKIKG